MPGDERVHRPHVEHDGAVGHLVEPLERRLGGEERAAVQRDDALHVRRSGRLWAGRGDRELLVILEQRVVEPPFEADRRRRLRAHRGAAERAGDVPGVDLDPVAERDEPVEAAEEVFGARVGLDREVRPGCVADEEGVSGQDEPGLAAARAVDHGEGGVLGTVPGRVERPQDDVADLDLRPVAQRVVRERGAGGLVHPHRQIVLQREASVSGDMVGVRVRLEDGDETHVSPLRLGEDCVDCIGRVDHDGDPRLLVSDEVRRAAEVVVHELPKQHGATVAPRAAMNPEVIGAGPWPARARPPPPGAA